MHNKGIVVVNGQFCKNPVAVGTRYCPFINAFPILRIDAGLTVHPLFFVDNFFLVVKKALVFIFVFARGEK
jgi:hypothetical protein